MIFYYLTRDSAKKKNGSSRALDSWSGREEKSRAKSGTARVYSLNDLRTRADPDFSRVISLSRPD